LKHEKWRKQDRSCCELDYEQSEII
jgi:hypothetical protein